MEGQVIEGFVGDEQNFVMDALLYREPVKLLKDGVMWSLERVWVRRRAAEF